MRSEYLCSPVSHPSLCKQVGQGESILLRAASGNSFLQEKTRAGLATRELLQELLRTEAPRPISQARTSMLKTSTFPLYQPFPTPSTLFSTGIWFPFYLSSLSPILPPTSQPPTPSLPSTCFMVFITGTNCSKTMGAQITIKFFWWIIILTNSYRLV